MDMGRWASLVLLRSMEKYRISQKKKQKYKVFGYLIHFAAPPASIVTYDIEYLVRNESQHTNNNKYRKCSLTKNKPKKK